MTNRFCEQCGTPLAPGANFCSDCGSASNPAATGSAPRADAAASSGYPPGQDALPSADQADMANGLRSARQKLAGVTIAGMVALVLLVLAVILLGDRRGGASQEAKPVIAMNEAPGDSLSNETAIGLIENSPPSRGLIPQGKRFARVLYPMNDAGIQRLVDLNLVRWDAPRQSSMINGAEDLGWSGNIGRLRYGVLAVPVYRATPAIESITTEGVRATVRYRVDYAPAQPFHNQFCVERLLPLVGPTEILGQQNCAPEPYSGSVRAVRSDDGRWQLE